MITVNINVADGLANGVFRTSIASTPLLKTCTPSLCSLTVTELAGKP